MTDQTELPAGTKAIRDALGKRSIVIVGLMGAGKSTVGRIVAQLLDMPFVDADHEIEAVSTMSIPELFETYGEPEFRALERRVIKRLLNNGPQVLATGGGAFMNEDTRRAIAKKGLSVWLKADIDLLMQRVMRKQNRPLLKTADPKATMRKLIDDRYPVYALADIVFTTRDEKKDVIAAEVTETIGRHLAEAGAGRAVQGGGR